VNSLHALLVGGLALAAAVGLTPIVRAVARRLGRVAAPRSDRWHSKPTALFGGVAVFASTAAGAVLLPSWPLPVVALALGSAGAFVVGLLDDILTFRPVTKLTLQVVIASAVLGAGVRLDWTGSLTIDSLLTVLWLVGLTNAFNLVDNIDGACAGIGAIAAATLVAIGLLVPGGPGPAAGLAAALGGALLGFLVFNRHPASIFLGDSGSLFIGFLLASLSGITAGPRAQLPAAAAAVPILVLLVPIFDTTLVTVSRRLSGRPVSRGGTDHTAHRLVALGFSETAAVRFLYLMAVVSGGAAILLMSLGKGSDVALAVLAIGLVLLGAALLRVRVYGGEDYSLLLRGRWRAALATQLVRHHVFEVLLDVVLVTASYYAAYRLRFVQAEFVVFFPTFLASLPVVIGCKVVSLRLVGAYGGIWRYFGSREALRVLNGVGLGSVMAVIAFAYLYRFEHVSRSVLVIDGVLLAVLLAGSRAAFRLLATFGEKPRPVSHRAIAYGAGDAGDMLARELENNGRYAYHLVAFLDDDPYKAGRSIRGVPVVGGVEGLAGWLESGVEAVILTTAKLRRPSVRAVQAVCREAHVPLLRFSCVIEEVGRPLDIAAGSLRSTRMSAADSGDPTPRAD
jgi:UDP-GlcNAc:undecaprenyl-phosphate/decaprenyl-phosphate GlcNAc-1-phosphate transferase